MTKNMVYLSDEEIETVPSGIKGLRKQAQVDNKYATTVTRMDTAKRSSLDKYISRKRKQINAAQKKRYEEEIIEETVEAEAE